MTILKYKQLLASVLMITSFFAMQSCAKADEDLTTVMSVLDSGYDDMEKVTFWHPVVSAGFGKCSY